MDEELKQALAAIAAGADRSAVAALYKKNTNKDLPESGPQAVDSSEVQQAHAAIAAGADPASVAAVFKKRTQQTLPDNPELAAQKNLSSGGNAVTDLLTMMSQGIPFVGKWSDELTGAIAGPAAKEADRKRMAALQLLNPGFTGAANLAQMAGGVAGAPVLMGIGGASAAAGQGAIPVITKGALMGGAMGLSSGLGAGQGSLAQRAPGAILPTLAGIGIGGTLAAAPVAANALINRMGGRAENLIGRLSEGAGVSPDVNATRQASQDLAAYTSAEQYGPLDALGKIDDPAINEWFKNQGLTVQPRTLSEMQRVVALTAKNNPAAAEDLTGLMDKAYPGGPDLPLLGGGALQNPSYADARGMFREAMQPATMVKAGAKAINQPAADIQWAQNVMADRGVTPDAQDAFRQGEFYKLAHKLLQTGDEGSLAMLQKYSRTGQLRTIFPDGDPGDAAYNEFQTLLKRNLSADKVKNILPWLGGIGIGVGAAGGAVIGAKKLSTYLGNLGDVGQ